MKRRRYRMDRDRDKRKGTVAMDPGTAGQDPDWKPPQMPGAQMANENQGPALHGGGRRALSSGRGAGPAGGRRGCVKFCGALEGKEGVWVGSLDDPLGKNDGSAGTVRYFTCAENHGTFAKPTNVNVETLRRAPDDDGWRGPFLSLRFRSY